MAGQPGTTRRQVLIGGAAATGAAWAAPTIVGIQAAAAATVPPGPLTLYGVSQSTGSLYRVDTGTGAWTLIGATGAGNPLGLAYDGDAGVLYGCNNSSTDDTFTVDTSTGAWTAVGATGSSAPQPQGMAYDSSTATMYGCDFGGTTHTVNTSTGLWTTLGSTGVSAPREMAYDSANDVLYGVAGTDLYTVSRTTGAWTSVGDTGVSVIGVAYDAVGDVLYVSTSGTGSLYTVDRSTAAVTSIGSAGITGPRGIEFAP